MSARILNKIINNKEFMKQHHFNQLIDSYQEFISDKDLKPKPKDKTNYIGLEIECFTSYTSDELDDRLLELDLEEFVQITDDGSITPDFGEAIEFRILIPEKKLEKGLKQFAKLFNSKKFGVNDSCGLHVHLDMRNRKVDTCYSKLLKFQDVLFGLVKKDRWNNEYCEYVNDDIDNRDERYVSINKSAYDTHKTIEIRLHHATLNLKAIQKWVNLLIKMVNSAPPKKIECRADVLKWANNKKSIKGYVTKNFKKAWFSEKASVIKKLKMQTDYDEPDNYSDSDDWS